MRNRPIICNLDYILKTGTRKGRIKSFKGPEAKLFKVGTFNIMAMLLYDK